MSGFNWLIMSLEKDDAQIIDSNSKMWGSLSYIDKVKRTEGTQTMLLKDGRLRSYMILKQGADDFSADLEELKKQIKVPETDHRPQLTEVDETASTTSKKNSSDVQSSSKVVKGTVVSVCLNLRKVDKIKKKMKNKTLFNVFFAIFYFGLVL